MLILTLRPHREPGGYHLDRFEAYLGGALTQLQIGTGFGGRLLDAGAAVAVYEVWR